MARRDPGSRYRDAIRHEVEDLDAFVKYETESAESLLELARLRSFELSDDEYRAVAYFKNAEYSMKPGSLALLYQTGKRLNKELPPSTVETIFDIVRFRFKMYCVVLRKGGYG